MKFQTYEVAYARYSAPSDSLRSSTSIRFRYNPFLLVWVLAYCIHWLTAPKYTLNPNRWRTGIALGGCVFVFIGFVVEIINMYTPS